MCPVWLRRFMAGGMAVTVVNGAMNAANTGLNMVDLCGVCGTVGTMGAAIKYMIENNWEANPGIAPGDMFTNNDCAIGNVHPCDIATIVPIFHDGRLIGWVGGETIVSDVALKSIVEANGWLHYVAPALGAALVLGIGKMASAKKSEPTAE